MKKLKTIRSTTLGLSALALLIIVLVGVSEVASQPGAAPRLASAPRIVVLYTIHQGPPDTAVGTFHKLVALRDGEGFVPAGDFATFVYLNQPARPSDQLIEVRIPVTDPALARRGTLGGTAPGYGLGTTDVKERPASTVATITKPGGVSDPAPSYNQLYNFIDSQKLIATDAPSERFEQVSSIPDDLPYDQLQTHLVVPVASATADTKAVRSGKEARQ